MLKKDKFDVIIAGGSFAGLYLASILPENLKIAVIEKTKKIGDYLGTTGSTPINSSDDIFTKFGISKNNIINGYKKISIYSKYNYIEDKTDKPFWCLLDIKRTKQELKKKCKNNVHFIMNSEIIKIILRDKKYESVIIKNKNTNKEIFGKIFVDGTGSSAILVKQANLKFPKHMSSCIQMDCTVTNKKIDSEKIEFYPNNYFSPGAYAYIFPLTDRKIRVGSCSVKDYCRHEVRIEECLEEFLKFKGYKIKDSINDFQVDVFTGGVTSKNYDRNLIAIGDSAGHISPVIGEGIKFSFYAAKIAKKLILEYPKNNRSFSKFKKEWEKNFGNTFFYAYILQNILGRSSQKLLAKTINYFKSSKEKNPDMLLRFLSTSFSKRDFLSLSRGVLWKKV